MVTVHLHKVLMYAHHGIYSGEEKIGANYELNLDVKFDEGNSAFERLEDTISYEDLYNIVRKKMLMPTPLLEKVCEGIIGKIRREFSGIREITISIYKLEAPIENFQGKVGVTMRKKFDD